MPPLFAPLLSGPGPEPTIIALRLVLALAFGAVVASIYRWARRSNDAASSFPMTLVLLCILIAMVTQVIGDNIARAFSLVGALSIVRFRTVVRDTKDTAYVILAVIAGMSVGAGNLWVAVLGLIVVTLAELLGRYAKSDPPAADYIIKLRAAEAQPWEAVVRQALGEVAEKIELLSVNKNGVSEAKLRLRIAGTGRLADVAQRLNALADIECTQVQLRTSDED